MVRQSIAERLDRCDGIVVVGQADGGESAIETSLEVKPDVVVMDAVLPGLESFEAFRRIRAERPSIFGLFVSAFIYDRYIEEALASGAKGFMSKTPEMDVLIEGIRAVARGEMFFCDTVKERLVIDGGNYSLKESASSRISLLTPREREVLRYLARGKPKKEIGEILDISVKTVDKHSENLMRKLAVNNRVQLTRLAIREGLSDL
jgi:DNA-binding NarL/FixJ family response regulator